jgi:hypothetical protein
MKHKSQVRHLASRYALILLAILIVLGNNASVRGQAINLCEIASLTFNYPNPAPANQPVTVITTIALYSCPVVPLSARVDLFNSRQNPISSSSNFVNSPRVDVTNTFAAPPTSGQYTVYVVAYMIMFASVAGSYRSSFQLTVVQQDQITSSASSVQSFSQNTLTSTTSSAFPTSLAQSTLASAESSSTAFAPTISTQNLSTIVPSDDVLTELIMGLAVLFMVTLIILSVRRRKKN